MWALSISCNYRPWFTNFRKTFLFILIKVMIIFTITTRTIFIDYLKTIRSYTFSTILGWNCEWGTCITKTIFLTILVSITIAFLTLISSSRKTKVITKINSCLIFRTFFTKTFITDNLIVFTIWINTSWFVRIYNLIWRALNANTIIPSEFSIWVTAWIWSTICLVILWSCTYLTINTFWFLVRNYNFLSWITL